MNKNEIKKLFWKIVNEVEDCCDTAIKNIAGVVVERGMQLSNGYSIMFGLDDGCLRLYNEKLEPILVFAEENGESLFALKELFNELEL